MRRIKGIDSTLFETTIGNFKMSIKSMFVKEDRNTGYSKDLLFLSPTTGVAYLNPDMYLVLSYRSVAQNLSYDLYTSYPQIHKFREAMNEIHNRIESDGFIADADGRLSVNPKYEHVLLTDLGKGKRWISFDLFIDVREDNEGMIVSELPAVSVQISSAENNVSVLTVDDFYTIKTIIDSLDLASLQVNAGLQMAIYQEISSGKVSQPTTGGNYQRKQQPTPPAGGYRAGYQTPSYQQPAKSKHSAMPPRENKSLMNFGEVDKVEVEDIDFDDEGALNDIFDN